MEGHALMEVSMPPLQYTFSIHIRPVYVPLSPSPYTRQYLLAHAPDSASRLCALTVPMYYKEGAECVVTRP